MAKIQLIGTGMDLSNGPDDMISTAFGGGDVQFVGGMADLGHETQPQGIFDKGISGGRVQMANTTMTDLSREPRRSWESYDTPISSNSQNASSPVSGYPSGGSRKGGR